MYIAEQLFEFFGFGQLADTATFVDLLYLILKIGTGLWVTIFIIRSMFMATTIGGRKFF